MRVFIGMETSGRVREAMRRRGHEAVSCDLRPADDGSPHHIIGDVMDHILRWKPDLAILHPTCTNLTHAGTLHLFIDGLKENGRDEIRWQDMERDALFFKELLALPVERIAIENPKMHQYAMDIIGRGPDQYVHPYWFGDDASKTTGLWLKGLPRLVPTAMVPPRMVNGLPRWGNQTDGGWNNVSNTPARWKKRSETFPGVAHAFASQWTPDLRGPAEMKFVRYDVRPVIEQNPKDDAEREVESFRTVAEWEARIEACKTHQIPYDAFWSIYGVDEEGMSLCIGDYNDEETAFEILEAILGVPTEAGQKLGTGYMAYKEARKDLLALCEGSTQKGSLR